MEGVDDGSDLPMPPPQASAAMNVDAPESGATDAMPQLWPAAPAAMQAAVLDAMPLPRLKTAAAPRAGGSGSSSDEDGRAEGAAPPPAALPPAEGAFGAPVVPRIRPLEELLRIKQQEDELLCLQQKKLRQQQQQQQELELAPKARPLVEGRVAHACYMRDEARAAERPGHDKYRVSARFFGERAPKQDLADALRRGAVHVGGLLAYEPAKRGAGGAFGAPTFVARIMEGGFVEYAEYVGGHRRAKWLSAQQFDAVCEWHAADAAPGGAPTFFPYDDEGSDDEAGADGGASRRSPFVLVAAPEKREAYIVRWVRFPYVGTWVHHVDGQASAGAPVAAAASGLPAAVRARLRYSAPLASENGGARVWRSLDELGVACSARGGVPRNIFIRYHQSMTHAASVDADGESPPAPLPAAHVPDAITTADFIVAAAGPKKASPAAASAAAKRKRASSDSDDDEDDDDDDEDDDEEEEEDDDEDDDDDDEIEDEDDDEDEDEIEEEDDEDEDEGDSSDDDDVPQANGKRKAAAAPPPPAKRPVGRPPGSKRPRIDVVAAAVAPSSSPAPASDEAEAARAAADGVLAQRLWARADFVAFERRLRGAAAAGGPLGLLAALRDAGGPERMLAPFVLYAWGARAQGPPPPASELDAFFA